MQPLFEHRLELAGYETRALELEGDGPPLLLFHGYADSADTWRLLLDHLGRSDRRAMALDLPGFGTAGLLEPGPILPQLDAFASKALEQFAPDGGAVVCGNSLGGCLALRLAERAPESVAGIVPVAPAGLEMARWFSVIERDPLLRRLLAAPVPMPRVAVQRVVGEVYKRLVFRHPGAIDPLVTRGFTSHIADRQTARRILDTGSRLLSELRDCVRPDLIECPVLLVWGRQDVMVFPTGADRVLETVERSELVTIEDCGHCPQLERPDRMAELLLDFPAADATAIAS